MMNAIQNDISVIIVNVPLNCKTQPLLRTDSLRQFLFTFVAHEKNRKLQLMVSLSVE